MSETPTLRLPGRKAQAARNDALILDAARTVFLRDPSAPIAAVAVEAGVGISALYRRYANKEGMIASLCAEGLERYIAAAERALASTARPWQRLLGFITEVVDEDVHSLTVRLAGTFTPTRELAELAERATALGAKVFDAAQEAGALRPGLVFNDLAMILEQATAVRVSDPARTRVLRRRYLALQLDALSARRSRGAPADLPGPPPSDAELGERWIPRD
ncbi:TetR family transcriptional regulator [Intrasporangium sp. DVR]|uniref:TetR/AcrR family transcriptional regulator n=1 Tax=Intrasporangium sp. DVR TaxID=3127867 RepID=UPI00313A6304